MWSEWPIITTWMLSTVELWQLLVHVCRRWRCLFFGSSRHLSLELLYDPKRCARTTLDVWDVWPPLSLHIPGNLFVRTLADNVIAVLEHSNRLCQINLSCFGTEQVEKLWRAMQVPFPELADLRLCLTEGSPYVPVLPDSFLSGSAPCLRFLALNFITFTGLPTLLCSAMHLVELRLCNIPPSGYISPEAMVACLTMLTCLKTLLLQFEFTQSFLDQEARRLPPPIRSILPVLTTFDFEGVNGYLEGLVARIDTPRLSWFTTEFLDDLDFHTPELIQFISRTPTLGAYDGAYLTFYSDGAQVGLRHDEFRANRILEIKVSFLEPDRELSTLAQICTLLSRCLLLTMEHLYIKGSSNSPLIQKSPAREWLDVMLPFMAVKNLYISRKYLPTVGFALQTLSGGRITEVLPSLQSILFEQSDLTWDGIWQFVYARLFTDRPVIISDWD